MASRYEVPLAFLLVALLLVACDGGGGPTGSANMPNPASVFCEENGGQIELRTDETGAVAGVCVFPDGSECDEWEYYRATCAAGEVPDG